MSQPACRRAARSPRVALLPGSSTRSVSPGSAVPGSRIARSTSGSRRSGSRSSKLLIRGSRGTTILMPPGRLRAGEPEDVLRRQLGGGREPGHDTQIGKARAPLDDRMRVVEERWITAEFVGDITFYEPLLIRLEQCHRADELGDDAAPLDVAGEDDGHVRSSRKAHIGDVAGPEIDLGRAAGAFDDHEVGRHRAAGRSFPARRPSARA